MIPNQQREAEPVLTPVDFLEAVAFGLIVVAAGLLATILLGTLLVLAFNATPSLTWLLGVLGFGALVLGRGEDLTMSCVGSKIVPDKAKSARKGSPPFEHFQHSQARF